LGEKAVWSAGASRDRTTPVGAWMRATKTGALKVAVLGGGNGSNGGNGDDAELRPTWSASELTDCGYRRTVDLDLDMTLLRDEAAVEEASAVAKGRIASNLVRNAHLLSCHLILKVRSFVYQGRLGTNIGKALNKEVRFFAGAREGAADRCGHSAKISLFSRRHFTTKKMNICPDRL